MPHSWSRAVPVALPSPWIVRLQPRPAPRLRLFCFPYAGGNANIFRSWAGRTPPDVEVIGIQYPGRGEHMASPPIDRIELLVEQLATAIAPWLDRNFMFFGHSNGALISFELARRLEPPFQHRLRHHFLSAREAPQSPRRRMISRLPKAEMIDALRRMDGTPDEILADELLMDTILPRLRADFRLAEDYVFAPGGATPCDATVLYGAADANVSEAGLAGWPEVVAGRVDFVRIDDGHFFLHSSEDAVLAVVLDKVADTHALPGPGAPVAGSRSASIRGDAARQPV